MQGINTILNSLVSLMKNMEITDPASSNQFTVGERLEAQVVSREGDNYLMQSGAKLFRAQSALNLPVGGKLILYVAEQNDGRTLLKIQVPASSGQAGDANQPASPKNILQDVPQLPQEALEQIKLLASKYGYSGEKEIAQLADQLAKLPVDEKTGVRYLLDPNLATAVIIPVPLRADEQAKIAIEQYKQTKGEQRVWEVNLDVNLHQLGQLEVVLKMIEGRIYARIWAEQPETEALLQERLGELDLATSLLEIVPPTLGPLIARDTEENIDLRV